MILNHRASILRSRATLASVTDYCGGLAAEDGHGTHGRIGRKQAQTAHKTVLSEFFAFSAVESQFAISSSTPAKPIAHPRSQRDRGYQVGFMVGRGRWPKQPGTEGRNKMRGPETRRRRLERRQRLKLGVEDGVLGDKTLETNSKH